MFPRYRVVVALLTGTRVSSLFSPANRIGQIFKAEASLGREQQLSWHRSQGLVYRK